MATKHPLPLALEPIGVQQALKDPHWRQAMSDEFTALVRHGTGKLVPTHPRQNLIGSKCVFRIKRKLDGSIDH